VREHGEFGSSVLTLVKKKRLFVFTDLDGTLLDPSDYEWGPAIGLLAELRKKSIPVVFCTSKTRAEVQDLQRRMGHKDPYIAENGGILVLPMAFLGRLVPRGDRPRELVLHLGWKHADILQVLRELAQRTKVSIRCFHQMTPKEIARTTGLTLAQSRRAQQRDASEPFQFVNASAAKIRDFQRVARLRGFELAQGTRFWHLTTGSDKGQAMQLVVQLSQIVSGVPALSIAAGDSSIDLPMLTQADLPILLPQPDGRMNSRLSRALPHALHGSQAGPHGWAHSVKQGVSRLEQSHASTRPPRPAAIAVGQLVPALREALPLPVREPQWTRTAVRKTTTSR
jgi:mannosyl-3-phosphoglycerate phosphatase